MAKWLSMAAALLLAQSATAQEPRARTAAAADRVFVISYRPGPRWRRGVPMREQGLGDHFRYVKALDESGRIAVAGPIGDDSGLMIVRVADLAGAQRIITEDPAVKAGLFADEARPFQPVFVGTAMAAVRP